ncbi:hypothetical protein NDU88_003192 [Pleurodeles waltl]|uniref:Uncharacterized protein n=1 Tax=Pleurodeles waltl TaxID=8319 RepID=A0AAV7UZF6_PLEWA|nr:hypothetical protein NDU88_003192 [Pleurodeles waltl]
MFLSSGIHIWSSSENASGSRKNTGKKTEEIPYGIHIWSSSENASGSRKNTGKKTEEIPYGKYLGCFLGFIVK